MSNVIEPPEGCKSYEEALGIESYIIVIPNGWLTQDGRSTDNFKDRGSWPTIEELEKAKNGFFNEDGLLK